MRRQIFGHRLSEPEALRDAVGNSAFIRRPVSSAIPKRPGPSASSTSSDVPPESASSKSWIRPAPLVASAETNPRSIRSMRIGERPVFKTCAPKPQRMPRSFARARRIAATIALKSAPARIEGIDASSPRRPAPGDTASRNLRRSPCSCATRADTCGSGEIEVVVGEFHGGIMTGQLSGISVSHQPSAISPEGEAGGELKADR